jgi:hypothetical protein
MAWNGFIWLSIELSGGFLCIWPWTFPFLALREFVDVTEDLLASE